MNFPISGPLDMQFIAGKLGVASNMNAFRSATLYNTTGTSYNPPQTGPLSIFYFRGRYYTNPRPYIAPVITRYRIFNTFTITPPPDKSRDPTHLNISLYGGGGGGGGGGGAAYSKGFNNPASGGGGGGGGRGGYNYISNIPYTNTTITAIVGRGGSGSSGGAGKSSEGDRGTNGNNGGNTSITINSITYTATGGTGGNGGGGGNTGNSGGPGGAGGAGGSPNIMNGGNGGNGENDYMFNNDGGTAGAGTTGYNVYLTTDVSKGAPGGGGGRTSQDGLDVIAYAGDGGSNESGDGIIAIVWVYT